MADAQEFDVEAILALLHFLTEHDAMKAYRESEGIAPLIP
jgi:hypothetical protein